MQLNLTENQMYQALLKRDESFEGLFFVAVKTTGIFCRPTCRARMPKKENVEYFQSAKEALLRGYRPCKVCTPMSPKGKAPEWVGKVLNEVSQGNSHRLSDREIRNVGVDPNRLRRWFKQNYGMTFQAYLRSLRLGTAFGHLANGKKVISTAYDNGYYSLSGFTHSFKKTIGIAPSESNSKSIIHVYQILTPLGPMMAASVKQGICLLEFIERKMLESELKDLSKRLDAPLVTSPGPHLKDLKIQLEQYFNGDRKKFDLPLFTPGSDFQKQVWKGLQNIPYGTTRSYKEQAKALGRPKAVRAVANANGANRIAIIIPCHRVIGTDGKLIGYGGGLWRKKRLLALENGSTFTSQNLSTYSMAT